jgi:MFS family permease
MKIRNDKAFNNRSLLKIPSFWLLISAQVCEQLGDSLNFILLLAALLGAFGGDANKANSALILPIFIPILLIGPVAGVFVDRYPRRWWLIGAAVCRGLFIALMAALSPYMAGGSREPLAGFMLMILLVSCVWQFYNPARSSALPEVVPPKQLELANSISITGLLLMQVMGYLVGGLMGDNISPARALWFNAAVYGVVTVLLSLVRFNPPPPHPFPKLSFKAVFNELLQALKELVGSRKHVAGPSLLVMGLLFATGLTFSQLKDFCSDLRYPEALATFNAFLSSLAGVQVGSLTRFVLLLFMAGLGAGLGIGLLGFLKEKVAQLWLIKGAILFAGFCNLWLARMETFAGAAVVAAGIGMGAMLVLALTEARIQANVPVHLRGKILSGYFLTRSAAASAGMALPGLLAFLSLNPGRPFILGLAAWMTLGIGLIYLAVGFFRTNRG